MHKHVYQRNQTNNPQTSQTKNIRQDFMKSIRNVEMFEMENYSTSKGKKRVTNRNVH